MTIRIALDAMGGDRGLPVNVEGALLAKKEMGHEILLVGDQKMIEQELSHHGAAGQFLIHHAPTVIGMHEKPAEACRAKKDSSIMQCAEIVSQGKADALISAGNSGATMAASLWHLRRLPGVSRPAIAAIFPTLEGNAVLLDVGANVDCKPKHLLQFAIMGSVYSRAVFGIASPRVGLLTIGEEEGKGNELTVQTHPLLQSSGLNYLGHLEGRDLPEGNADVFVCDGFVGNVLLKFGEGLASAVLKLIKNEVRKHPLAIFGRVLLKGAFKELIKKTDPSEFGGAPLLGVNGVALIAHGGSDVKAVKNSVRTAAAFVEKGINRQISDQIHSHVSVPVPVAVPV